MVLNTDMKPLKIGIYSPYLDTAGGGEKYILTIAEILSKNSQVDILIDEHLQSLGPEQILKQAGKRFDLDLAKVNLVKAPVGKGSNLVSRSFFLKQYDFLFYLTDGSIFYSTAKNSILHFQSPLSNVNRGSWGKIKLSSWKLAICNSSFTEALIKNNWSVKTQVVYPPVDTSRMRSLKKKKYILSVGRLLGYRSPKKHQVLIDVFKELVDSKKLEDWSLHIVGYISPEELKDLEQREEELRGYPIKFYPNYLYKNLLKLYGESSIYWHATGFGEENPIDMEHFGISTVEAMASGCVPVVINLGGQKEIIEDGQSGYLWDNVEDLKKYTLEVVGNNKKMEQMSIKAKEKSVVYSKEEFTKKILNLVYGR